MIFQKPNLIAECRAIGLARIRNDKRRFSWMVSMRSDSHPWWSHQTEKTASYFGKSSRANCTEFSLLFEEQQQKWPSGSRWIGARIIEGSSDTITPSKCTGIFHFRGNHQLNFECYRWSLLNSLCKVSQFSLPSSPLNTSTVYFS